MRRILTVAVTAAAITIPVAAIPGQSPGQLEITYSRDVAPILFEHCIFCHRPGEVAPFSMLTFATTRPWARSLKQQVLMHRMPPWFLDSQYGDFQNARQLSEKDLQTLVAWVDGGSREGNPADMPSPPRFGVGWEIGNPDLVVKMTEAYKIPAGSVVPQVTLPTDYVFPEDTWVQAIEVRPGNRKVVHQALAVIGTSGLATGLQLYSPGLPATIFREGYGRFIPKGTRIYLRMHYNAIGEATSDQSEVGFKFATKPVHTEVRTGIADANVSSAPSILDSHDSVTTFPLSQDARIHAFRPHMSTRGTTATVTLVMTDRARKILLSVAGWSDNWEYSYVPARPVDVPRGSVLEYAASPNIDAKSATATHLLYFDWTAVNPANKDDLEPIQIPASPLFTTGVRAR
jgi:hypothetical protein